MLITRVLTVAIALPLFLGLIWAGGWPFALMVCVLALIAYFEYVGLWAATGVRVPTAAGAATAVGLVLAAALGGMDAVSPVLFLAVVGLMLAPVLRPSRWSARDGVVGLAGVVYVGWLMAHWVVLRALPGGLAAIMFAFVCTWVTDTGAYFGGRALGRHKLAPRVSPGKTVEGFCTGVAAAAVAGGLMAPWLGGPGRWLPAALLAVAISVLGQLADLAESALKRHAGVKDSGALLPGHGGILDRFDSALVTLPLTYYAVVTWWAG